MMNNDSIDCQEGELYIHSLAFKLACGYQAVVSIAAIFSNCMFIRNEYHLLYFHVNVKIIIIASLLVNIGHSLGLAVIMSTHLFLYVSSSDGCQVLVPMLFCWVTRGSVAITIVLFTPLNSAIVVERWFATKYRDSYEKGGRRLGIAMIAISIALAFMISIYVALQSDLKPGKYAYCAATSATNAGYMAAGSFLQLFVELVTLLFYYIIWWQNKMKRRRRVFNVQTQYQVDENIAVLCLLWPRVLFHLCLFTAMSIANGVVPLALQWDDTLSMRVALNFVYVRKLFSNQKFQWLPIYCFFSPFFLSWIGRKQKRERTKKLQQLAKSTASGEEYQKYLQGIWN